MKPTCYDILGVAPDAAPEAIKAAYRRLLKQLHPDLHGPAARGRLDEVVRAYRVLATPASREQYDRSLGFQPTEDGWRGLVTRLRQWLGEADTTARDLPATPKASVASAPQREQASFEQAMHVASAQPETGYVRGADGIIRRVGPARPLPEFSGTSGRPAVPQRNPLPKERPWHLW